MKKKTRERLMYVITIFLTIMFSMSLLVSLIR